MNSVVIFDLDGTVVDSLDDIVACMNHTFEKFSLPTHTKDEYRFLLGSGIKTVIEKTLDMDDEDKINEINDYYQPYYIAHNCDHSKPYDGIVDMLAHLRGAGIKVSVLSNKPHLQTVSVIKKLFGDDVFDLVWGHMEDKYPRKPEPDSLLAMIEEMGGDREHAIYVGDSGVDILAARNAKVTEAGVAWGLRPPDELYELKTEFVAQTVSELEKFLLERCKTTKKA